MTNVSIIKKPIHLQGKSMACFLYDRDLRHERVNKDPLPLSLPPPITKGRRKRCFESELFLWNSLQDISVSAVLEDLKANKWESLIDWVWQVHLRPDQYRKEYPGKLDLSQK